MTLRDAVKHTTSLPRDAQNAETLATRRDTACDYWRARRLCMFFAERAVAFGLRKGVNDDPPEFDPER